MSRSLILARPPMHPDDDLDPPPASILLDRRGYIDDRTNATTAEGVTSGGMRIKVTFWMAHPPRCSCFTVCSPDLEDSAFGGIPMLLCTEDDLALLRIPICPLGRDGVVSNNDHFVYQAGNENKPPSLDLIPRSPSRFFWDDQAGLLRCRDRNMYFVALLCWAFRVGHYSLHLFNSQTQTWITKSMHLAKAEQEVLYTYSSKVINIGGDLGSMGWVDLWRGILICDVLEDIPQLRYIPLPSPLVPRPLDSYHPLYFRDIIVVGGYINYFEMSFDVVPEGWKAATWRRKESWNEWKQERLIQVSQDPAHGDTDQQEAETKEQQPTLKGFYSGYPALSLHDADVVYIMDRRNLDDTNVTLVAVDTRKQTLKAMAGYFSPRPLPYSFLYLGSGISKHLRRTSSRSDTETSKRGTLQLGKQGVPRKNVQSHQSSKNADGTHAKCRGRRGHCKQAYKLEVPGKNDIN